MEGRKDDQGKLRMDLLPADVIEALATILTDGADRYGDRNWEQGMAWSRPYAALLRHIFAWWQGENQDPDSGRPHSWHALCCMAFLVAYEQRGIGTDDRPVDNDLAEWVKYMVDNAGHDPDNEEWESDGDVMTDAEEADPEIVDKDTITDCMGNYFGRWCPNCGSEMEVVRPGKVQCSQSCDRQEASEDVMSELEKAEWIEKAKQGIVEGWKGAKKCGKCHGVGQTFMPETDSWITCRVCDGVGYVN